MEFNLFEAIYMSFYSKRLYRDVVNSWGGYTILYLAMLVALTWITVISQTQNNISQGYRKNGAMFLRQFPVLTFDKGTLSTPQKRAYLIRNPENMDLIGIIDTTGKYKDINNTTAKILVTATQIFTRKSSNETRVYTIPKNYTGTIEAINIYRFLNSIIDLLWVPMFIVCFVFSFLFRLAQACFYALLGKLFNYFYQGVNLTYGQIAQIAMVALTPAIVISTLQGFFSFHLQQQWLIYFLLTTLYLFYGIVANKNS